MQPTILAVFLAFSGAALSMSAAGLALLAIGLLAGKNDLAQARGMDKIVALTHLCFAIPLAVFGAEHLSSQQALLALVPSYMPWRMFWVYFVGFALIAASLSIATRHQVRWSGLLFGAMMFLFVAMLHLPGAVTAGGRIPWTIVIREMSFGGGGWVLAGIAMGWVRVLSLWAACRSRSRRSFSAFSTFCIRWDFPEFRSRNRCLRGFPFAPSSTM
jgi:uncharacterized membrane protein